MQLPDTGMPKPWRLVAWPFVAVILAVYTAAYGAAIGVVLACRWTVGKEKDDG